MPALFLRYCLLAFALALPLAAHTGPPFPIIVDRHAGPVVVSLWTHPDTGWGTFFVVVNPEAGHSIPKDLKFDIAVQPATGRLAWARYPMERQHNWFSSQLQYNVLVPFDKEEVWKVKLFVLSKEGNSDVSASVMVTPPGLGAWDLLLYSFPFLGVGFLWFKVMSRRRKLTRQLRTAQSKAAVAKDESA